MFADRVSDGAKTATAVLTLGLGQRVLEIERHLSNLRLERFEIADVLTEKHVLAHGDGDRVLKMTSDREHRRQFVGHVNSQWSIAAGPA